MTELPTGPVTFCFTDIEGSTRLARRLGEGWRSVLDRHNQLLRAVWAAHDGVEVKTEGDAFFVVFVDAGRAVEAALAGQRALGAEPWPDGGDVRVRVGLHTGEAEVADRDYVGVEVHKAARVAAVAHGGQVLLSESAAARVADVGLPPGASLRDLGRFALKDFEEGERLLQLEHPWLDAEVPTPRAMPVEAHNLPLLRTTFVGRDVERVEVAKLCDHHPLVTVVGPGGAGKTRLALEVGRAVATDYEDGVWAVLLAGEAPGTDITPVVARTLGVADVPGTAPQDALAAALRDKRLVLVLDNCEHVVESTAALVGHLLASCPDLSVLVTSRQPLGLAGEKVWALPTLSVPPPGPSTRAAVLESEAGRLFAERAEDANPRFALTDADAEAVAVVCRAVDGLPLAIELAATMTRAVPLRTLAARLDEGTAVLRSSSPGLAPRQRAIDDLIAWSYDLLDEVQAAVFRRLAVFRGGWTADAAERVCAGPGVEAHDVLPALADLADRSLVNIDADDRYRMLVLIRGFAEARLSEAGEVGDVEAAHLEHFVQLATTLVGQGATPASLLVAEVEGANLEAAFRRAVAGRRATAARALFNAFGAGLIHRGHYQATDHALVALEPLFDDDAGEQVRIALMRSQMARVRGELARAMDLSDAAMARVNDLGDPDLQAAAAAEKAFVVIQGGGDRQSTVPWLREALALPGVSALRRAVLLEVLGMVLRDNDDEEAGIAAALESAALYEQSNEPVRAAVARLEVAELVAIGGNAPRAVDIVVRALALADEIGAPRVRAHALYASSLVRRTGDDPVFRALPAEGPALDEAVAIASELGEPRLVVVVHTERAIARARSGDMSGAADDIGVVFPAFRAVRIENAMRRTLVVAALVLAERADPAAGIVATTGIAVGEPQDGLDGFGPALREVQDRFPGEAISLDAAVDLVIERLG